MRISSFHKSVQVSLVGLLLACQVSAQDRPVRVARVIDIDGPRLYSNRLKTNSWFQAYPGMNAYLSEKLRTDKQTQAVLEFGIGARAGIGRSSQVVVVSNAKIENVQGSSLRIDAGNFWAKFDKQEEQFQIQTAGGVIGVEGTELLVGVDEETGVTEVLLFEGQVSVTDDKGNKKTMFPGDYAEFGGSKGMCVLSYPSASLRTLIVERYPAFSSFLASQNVTSIPKPASPTLIRGNNKTRSSLMAVLASATDLTGATSPSGLSPSEKSVSSGPPSFTWSAVPGAESYALFLTSDQAMEDVVFSSRVDAETFTIPDGAQGLEGGRYFWSVIPLNKDGEPLSQASQTWFETSGWATAGVELEDDLED